MPEFTVSYRNPDDADIIESLDVEADDLGDAEEAARERLSASHPSIDTDEWDVVEVVPTVDDEPHP